MRNNPARLAQLKQLLILDTAPEVIYDDLTRAMADNFNVPIAMVNMLDAERDWFKSCIGLPFGESSASTSFCEAFFSVPDDLIVVEDTAIAPRFAEHPLVAGPPNIRFYASARLQVNGETVGTLCAYDTKPHVVHRPQIDQLQLLRKVALELLEKRAAGVSRAEIP